ncbi:MarR family winged helix-turn-helix transcriptional regulator [Streptomyces sp. NPDC002701]|uniref:MarR family winged helix-turn-helix transcriptional regulator n=1 Tax=Streptomyces sp. NPDC002701 TaxID=3364661 RepID=UPI00369906DE
MPAPCIPASRLRVMCIVDRKEGIRMRALTHLLGAAPPSTCRLVDRRQALGFIQRRPHPGSRREVTLALTRAGRTHLSRIRQRRDALLTHTLTAMPAHQRTALTESLTALHQALLHQLTLRPAPKDASADSAA